MGGGQLALNLARENFYPAIALVLFKAMWESLTGGSDDDDKEKWLCGLCSDLAGETLDYFTSAISLLNVMNSPGRGGPRVAMLDYPYNLVSGTKKGVGNLANGEITQGMWDLPRV